MLITVPCADRIDPRDPESDFWRWTPAGLRALLTRQCEGAKVEVEVAAISVRAGDVLGCAVEDLRPDDLDGNDPRFPIVACAAVTKPVSQ